MCFSFLFFPVLNDSTLPDLDLLYETWILRFAKTVHAGEGINPLVTDYCIFKDIVFEWSFASDVKSISTSLRRHWLVFVEKWWQ